MYLVKIVIAITLCFKLTIAYEQSENENIEKLENNHNDFAENKSRAISTIQLSTNDTNQEVNMDLDIGRIILNYGSQANSNIIWAPNNNAKNSNIKHTIEVNYKVVENTFGVIYKNLSSNNGSTDLNTNFENNKTEGILNDESLKTNNATKATTRMDVETTTTPELVKDESSLADNVTEPTTSFDNTTITSTKIDQNNDENGNINHNAILPTVVSVATINNTDLFPLSFEVGDANAGQRINLEYSKSEVNVTINTVGAEIVRNLSTTCGYYLGKRVSFGHPTTLMQYPWTALLLYNSHERYHCGGSLITWKYVLTAAHCVAQEFYELSGVRLGEHDLTTKEDCAEDVGGAKICSSTIDVNIVKIIIHHEYSTITHQNDIALLKLEQEVGISRSYYPICLPKADENVLERVTGIVAGWGATEKTIRSSVLMEADVPILDMSKCREVYRYKKFNDSTEMCGSGVNEVDVCKGDSGGAIFYRNSGLAQKERFVQMGIISLGVLGCGDSRFLPAVFTKLPAYVKWIENNLEN